MDHAENRSGATKPGCKNCGNCKKGGCGSIAAGLKLEAALDGFVAHAHNAKGEPEPARVIAAE